MSVENCDAHYGWEQVEECGHCLRADREKLARALGVLRDAMKDVGRHSVWCDVRPPGPGRLQEPKPLCSCWVGRAEELLK